MVMSWSVVVRNDDETVRLYCPTCWETAQKVVADFHGVKMKMYKEALSYDDVLLVPQYSDIESRREVSLQSQLGHYILELPIIASPMDTIVEAEMAAAMADLGGLGIIHRYNTIEEQVSIASKAAMQVNNNSVGAAIPISGDFIERAQALMQVGVKFMCIDVAHGDHIMMKTALDALRSKLPGHVHIMAGNVATQEGMRDLLSGALTLFVLESVEVLSVLLVSKPGMVFQHLLPLLTVQSLATLELMQLSLMVVLKLVAIL